jgi:hypothetical protein
LIKSNIKLLKTNKNFMKADYDTVSERMTGFFFHSHPLSIQLHPQGLEGVGVGEGKPSL